MSLLPVERVRGEHLVDRDFATPLPHEATSAGPGEILRAAKVPVQAVTWRMLGDRMVAEIRTAEGLRLLDAATGTPLPPIEAAQAVAIARAAWRGAAKPAAFADRVTAPTTEYHGALPAWRVTLAGSDHARIFIAADSGRITAVRTGTWRLYDFFWGLHIMDWKNHEDFNTPWLAGFAVGGLTLGIAGSILLYLRWPRRKRVRPNPS